MDTLLDAHAKPPSNLREVYKEYHKVKAKALETHPGLIQFDGHTDSHRNDARPADMMKLPTELRQIFEHLLGRTIAEGADSTDRTVYEVPDVPGMLDTSPFDMRY
jgi:hypothetical protein